MYCVTIDQVVTLFYIKEHMYCVIIYQIVTLFWFFGCKGTHILCYNRPYSSNINNKNNNEYVLLGYLVPHLLSSNTNWCYESYVF